jgi:hypothetical protein
MTSTLILLIVIFVLALLWLDGARARELAIAISKAACKRQGLQLLDDTVFRERIGLRWTPRGLRFRRMFKFEYSTEGTLRQSGYILLIGAELELIHLQNESQDPTDVKDTYR